MDSPQLDSRSIKILEIGVVRLLSVALNDQVRFVDTRFSILPTASTVARLRQAFKQALALATEIRRAEYGLIMCRAFGRFAWSKDNPFITNVIRWIMRQFMAFCVSYRSHSAKLVIIDIEDELTLDHRDLRLLQQCHLYFKRELAQNAWTNLLRVQPPRGEYQAMMRDPRFRKLVTKFRPLSLGISEESVAEIELHWANGTVPKCYDIFFAGKTENSTVREIGLQWLRKLKEEGYAVYLPEQPLPRKAFNEAMSASWLVWSPEGSGWDCFRHYEVCLAGSVPIINFPTIRRHAPLLDGVHCFYYGIEDDDLSQKVRAALADKPRLTKIAQAGRKHVLEHHTQERLGAYILKEFGA
jgi:hypothetical protein